ncbi:MAG: ABC transporter permease [Candidatus Methylacidiphilales bacterium]
MNGGESAEEGGAAALSKPAHSAPAREPRPAGLKPLWAVTRARFRMLLRYRGAALGGFITQVFFGLMFVMVYRVLYEGDGAAEGAPMELSQVVTYLWLNQALFAMQPWQPDPEVRQMIRTGSVAYELTRPCSLFWLWVARAIAMRSAPTLLRSVPLVAVAMLFFGMQLPASPEAAVLYVVSLTAALLLSSAITVVLNSSLFWTMSGEGITMLMPAIVMTLSGQNIPLLFYPAWMQPFMAWQPFRGLLDVPSRIYTGSLSPDRALLEIAGQFAWCAVILAIGHWMVHRGTRRLVVQGG